MVSAWGVMGGSMLVIGYLAEVRPAAVGLTYAISTTNVLVVV